MELSEAISNRRSIRTYLQKSIPKDIIEKIIAAGIWAPTACNRQGFRFIVIDDDRIKAKLIEEGAAGFIKSAPAGILVLYDNRTDNTEYADHIQSAAAAIENMLLMAHSLKIGTCWICHLPRKKDVRRILHIPDYFEPIAYVTLGYFENSPKPHPRQPTNYFISFNNFSFETKKSSSLSIAAKRGLRKAYFRLPAKAKKVVNPMASKLEKRFEGT